MLRRGELTQEVLANALWSSFYHMELDDLAYAIADKKIDGNDHPALKKTAEKLLERILDELSFEEADDVTSK